MGKSNKIVIYSNEKGVCQLDEFYDSLNASHKQKVDAILNQLEIEGEELPRPFADILRNGIHELRIKLSKREERILYYFVFQCYIVLTHQFSKRTNTVPESEINYAIKCRDDFARRFPTAEALEDYYNS